MTQYRLIIELKSSLITPLFADVIFGHICWAIRHKHGSEFLEKNILQFFRNKNKPPFIISDAFIHNHLPVPIIPLKKEDKKLEKDIKSITFMPIDIFEKIRKNLSPSSLFSELKKILDSPDQKQNYILKAIPVFHNVINRLSGTSLHEQGLYSIKETFYAEIQDDKFIPTKLDIYFKLFNFDIDLIKEAFSNLEKKGLGAKSSSGKGAFYIKNWEENPDIFKKNIESPNAVMSLSNFVPSSYDPINGYYKTFIKYGKLGENYATSGTPFKKPMLFLTAGSTFKTNEIKEFYGKCFENIAPGHPEVIQYAFMFPIPIRLEEN